MNSVYSFIFLLFLGPFVFSQGNHDIVVLDISSKNDTTFSLINPVNITNRDGYDNQPFFNADGSFLYYTSIRENQSDIFEYNFKKAKSKQLTKTPESEYSPQIIGDTAISVVRVDKDSLQRLYLYDLKNKNVSLLTKHQDSVGYYEWINDSTLAIFVLPEPFELRIITIGQKKYKKVTENLGHSFHLNPITGNLMFITEYGPGEWFISELKNIDTYNFEVNPIINCIDNAMNFTVSKNGDILLTTGPKVYKYNPKYDKNWIIIYDGTADGFKHFYRISINDEMTKIALVTKDPLNE